MTPKELLTSSAEELISKLIDSQAHKLMPEQIVNVVNQHCKLAAGAGLVPVPGADIVMGSANTLKMFQAINKTLGISSVGIDLKTIITALFSQFASRFTVSGITNILKFIPGAGQATGAVVSSVMQYLLALTAGYVYFNALALLVDDKGHISLNKLGDAINTTMADKEKTDAMFDAIKSNATQLFTSVNDNVSAWTSTAANGISSAANSVSKGASELYGTASEGISSLAGSVAETTSSLYSSASEGISSAASSVAGVASSAAETMKSGASSVIDKAGKGFSTLGKSMSGLWAKKKNKDE